jgi:hypothetical protein
VGFRNIRHKHESIASLNATECHALKYAVNIGNTEKGTRRLTITQMKN